MSDQDKIAELEAELVKYRQAVGLATTFAGEVVMNPDDPLAMMQEIEKAVHKELADLEQLFTQCAGVSLALTGNTSSDECSEGDYGWSPDFDVALRLRKVAERGENCDDGKCEKCFQCVMSELDPEFADQMKTIREITSDESYPEVPEGQQSP